MLEILHADASLIVNTVITVYLVFESFEYNAAQEWQLALNGQTAQSRNLVLIWLKNPVLPQLSARGVAGCARHNMKSRKRIPPNLAAEPSKLVGTPPALKKRVHANS